MEKYYDRFVPGRFIMGKYYDVFVPGCFIIVPGCDVFTLLSSSANYCLHDARNDFRYYLDNGVRLMFRITGLD